MVPGPPIKGFAHMSEKETVIQDVPAIRYQMHAENGSSIELIPFHMRFQADKIVKQSISHKRL